MTGTSITGEVGGPRAVRRAGYWLLRAPWSALERDRVAAAHLDDSERAALTRLTAWARDDRVRGRVVAKDAVRAWLAERGVDGIGRRDVTVDNDAAGRPRVRVGGGRQVGAVPAVSIAHRSPVAVAVAADVATGIDLEVVEPRGPVFARLALAEAELRLGDAAAIDPDAWVTRAWTVKEAVAKAAGTGLQGRPKAFVVREVAGDWALATGPDAPGGLWVRSGREGDAIVSVVVGPHAPPAPSPDA